jgi:hypothetical protein
MIVAGPTRQASDAAGRRDALARESFADGIAPLATPRNSSRRAATTRWSVAAVPILLIGAFYLLTLREGHEWGDDFAMYIRHAQNIAEGRAYADTGYIYNPDFPELSPKAYPPITPLLLAPVYAAFGLSLTPLKTALVLTFVASLLVCWLAFRDVLTTAERVALVALVGLNPYLWAYKDSIASEFPFTMLTYLGLALAQRAYDTPGPVGWRRLLSIGLVVYLAYGARVIGLILVPSLWLYERLVARRPGLLAWQTTALFAVGATAQGLLAPGGSSYLDQVRISPQVVWDNAISLTKAFSWFLDNGRSAPLHLALFAAVSALALAGLCLRMRRGVTLYEVFLGFFLIVTVAWPETSWAHRFLIPLVPLYFVYVLEGLRWIVTIAPGPQARRPHGVALASLVVLVGAAYVSQYTVLSFGPITTGVEQPEAVAVFDYVRESTAPDAVFVFQKPRALALFTNRRASGYEVQADDATLWRYFQSIGTDYLIVARDFEDDQRTLAPWVARNAEKVEPVYARDGFTVYRVAGGDHVPAAGGGR